MDTVHFIYSPAPGPLHFSMPLAKAPYGMAPVISRCDKNLHFQLGLFKRELVKCTQDDPANFTPTPFNGYSINEISQLHCVGNLGSPASVH
ncbi:hypothetical protein F0562_024382 [Nyssa sinensis]|uniref:Uncharacterized protein n=1 Tax=Nyssa sinensis TaxID=561372 RepID=A0A5J5BDE0_9ASTE|nr:hypothetical protein F0562_024382 [Nyssa sinensis]